MTKLATLLEKLIENPGNFSPKVDIIDYTNSLKILVELPGVEKDNIKISFQNNLLTISGQYMDPERNHVNIPETQEMINERKTDINYGNFSRKIYLDFNITSIDGINTKLENGILKVNVNKNLQTQNTFSVKIND